MRVRFILFVEIECGNHNFSFQGRCPSLCFPLDKASNSFALYKSSSPEARRKIIFAVQEAGASTRIRELNEAHRYFIHGDYHQYNILSDGRRITDIIDLNGKCGDFLVDLATLDWHVEKFEVIKAYRNEQQKLGIPVPDFQERIIGAKYYNGLIGLRFYAKMGWLEELHAPQSIINYEVNDTCYTYSPVPNA